MAICNIPDCDAHLGCRLRAKGIALGAGATPTRTRRSGGEKPIYNRWENGVVGEHRPDGSFMPYLSRTGGVMRTKEMAEHRHEYETRAESLRSDPNVFAGNPAGTVT